MRFPLSLVPLRALKTQTPWLGPPPTGSQRKTKKKKEKREKSRTLLFFFFYRPFLFLDRILLQKHLSSLPGAKDRNKSLTSREEDSQVCQSVNYEHFSSTIFSLIIITCPEIIALMSVIRVGRDDTVMVKIFFL